MKLMQIYASLKSDLQTIEDTLASSVASDLPLLNESAQHLLKAGGKRLRPVFVLLGGKFGDYDLERIQYVASALELIHMASLVHDDVIDDADTRRGQQTVKAKWDNRIAMFTGDYINGKALVVASQLRDARIHQILSGAIVQMCIGEMEQIRDFFNVEQSVRNYLLRIRRKTALLIAISCQLGAIAAGAPKEFADALYRYGYRVGMAFQITDDLLDVCGTEKKIGKPPGSDLRQGNITLPVLYALQESGLRDQLLAEIERIRAGAGEANSSAAVKLVRGSGGIKASERLADRYTAGALHELDRLPNTPAKRNLAEIAKFVAQRSY
ncbi:polyprenyl synthetase family protein [Cohnella lubricantis]|uniref:Polyprenyl synthetase family protein n=1 Tax=Cohnella lubricantis TaxID=2163172 RepID=A0A841TEU9_9BACL|nr:polyprenyl synthetase family protein [Cohnella lubricantis]MBB6677750.1 polyprenyl synthetase family protein [Cohnella lubricantis]MBP2117712.1 heptaprenyl diphosphate synthase [Cohnella lubricantis]